MTTFAEQTIAEVGRRLREALVAAYGVEVGTECWADAIAWAWEQLSEPQRVAVLAVHAFGWSQQEVADLLGISHSTLRTHLARGIDKLRTIMEVPTNAC